MDQIKNIADLLNEIFKSNVLKAENYLEDNGTKHPVLIGDIYEGVTADLLRRTLFEELNLKVVTGQVRLHNGELSNQIDCIIVKGNPQKMPFTDKYECCIDDVIAVIEVKKTLYKDELKDSLIKMQNIVKGFDIEKSKTPISEEEIYRGYEMLTGKILEDIGDYTDENIDKNNFNSILINNLILDYSMPLRIIFGYDGYSNEITLRDGYLNIIENEKDILMGPLMPPNLIICNNSSLIKTNGMPYGIRMEKVYTDKFIGMASYETTPILILLEVIWTKLCNIFRDKLDYSIFGNEIKYENIFPLLIYEFNKYKGKYGFNGIIIPSKKITRKTHRIDSINNLEYKKIDNNICVILSILSKKGKISLLDKDFIKYCENEKINLIQLKKELVKTGYVKIRKDKIILRDKEDFVIEYTPEGIFLVH